MNPDEVKSITFVWDEDTGGSGKASSPTHTVGEATEPQPRRITAEETQMSAAHARKHPRSNPAANFERGPVRKRVRWAEETKSARTNDQRHTQAESEPSLAKQNLSSPCAEQPELERAYKEKEGESSRKNNKDLGKGTDLPDTKPRAKEKPIISDYSTHEHEPVRALASGTASLEENMLRTQVFIGGVIRTAHLDTCATHCFLSSKASMTMAAEGYPPYESNVRYAVEQGNPLCVTSKVHVVPLSAARNDGSIACWAAMLFIVADCGADIIIGYPTLHWGKIIDYNPPLGYEQSLQRIASGITPATTGLMDSMAKHILTLGKAYQYGEPNQVVVLKTETTALPESGANTPMTDTHKGERVQNLRPLTPPKTVRSAPEPGTKKVPTNFTKSTVAALSISEPYGKNPALPTEVMEALSLLKMLAETESPAYTEDQLKEVQIKLGARRPQWSQCLTPQHLLEVSNKEYESLIYNLMDKPRYQKSIFVTAMHLNTTSDFNDFEINQKPGRDEWNPPQPRLYKNPSTLKIVDDWLDTLLLNSKCRESNATHPAPVTVVERPKKEPRVCLDYRNRNHRTEVPIYPMPDVHDFLEEAVGFEHYCSFDMAKMFTQFRIKEEHKHLAAFITHRGVYEPNVVMFGLAGAPQHAVREVGGSMAKDPRTNGTKFTEWALEQNMNGVEPPYDICPITKIVKGSRLRPFIDDVFIRSMHAEGMLKMVELFFEFCLDHHLILSRKKANIMKKRLRTLGFVVSKEGKHLDPTRIIALLDAPRPTSKETLHSMLSSYTFIRMFIPNFASIASPLYEATRGIIWKGPQSGRSKGIRTVDPNFVWTGEMIRAYEQLRSALLDAPILASPDYNLPLFLSVDASMRGEGWVLWQLITTSDGAKVAAAILYGSRKYSETEQKWETTRQEATAIKSALTDVQEYVFGQHFYLFSDHLNLRFMHNSVNRAVQRMKDFLAQFNMTVVHCPGVWNNADAVSRLETVALPVELASDLNSATTAELREAGLQISRGTSTEERDYNETTDKIVPVRGGADLEAVVLLSGICPTKIRDEGLHSPECWLCRLGGMQDIEPEVASDVTLGPRIFCTTTAGNYIEKDEPGWMEDNSPILRQILRDAGCDLDLTDIEQLASSAKAWNERPVLYASDLDHPEQFDEADQDDLEWCEEIRREDVEVKVCRSVGFVPREPAIGTTRPTDLEPKEHQRSPDVLCSRTEFRAENTSTQTTPADFRMVAVSIPEIEDFKAIHNDISGHHGLEFSYRKLIRRCGSKWANERGQATKIKEQLKFFIDGCPTCQKLRGLREKIKCKHSFIISRPFLEISYDFIVFKKPDRHGYRYILAAIDNFTKLVELKAVKNRDAETVANFLLELSARYGPTARLRSDNEGSFVGQIITKLNKHRGTEVTPCVPYRPEANSISERQNAIITYHLTALILGCHLGPQTKISWSELIPTVFSIINNTPKNPLGISPLSMVYGVFANYDRPLLEPSGNLQGERSNPIDYVDTLMEWQNKLLDIAEDIQSDHFRKLEKRFNADRRVRTFNQGDFVIQLKNSTGLSGKPISRWIGPFLVLERRFNDPTHPVLDLMNLTDLTKKEAAADDCRVFNTSWFEEDSMMHEMAKMAAQDLDEYVVEKILDHRPSGEVRKVPLSKYFFLVKWEEFEEPTWEPYSGIKNLKPLDIYSSKYPGLKIPMSNDNAL